MTAFAEFCHCAHTKCSERGASVASPSVACRKRRLSVLLTSAMPSGAARLAETNRFPLSDRSRLESMKNPNIGGASFVTGCRRSLLMHAKQIKTSVRFEAVGVTIVVLNVLAQSERDFALCLLLRRHFQSHIVTNAGGRFFSQTCSSERGVDTSSSIVVGSMFG